MQNLRSAQKQASCHTTTKINHNIKTSKPYGVIGIDNLELGSTTEGISYILSWSFHKWWRITYSN